MTTVAALVPLVAAATPAPVTLTVRSSDARTIASFLATRPSSRRICTQIYGGRQRARITGTIGTRRIDRRLKRTNGCEIGDWQHAVPLVPRVRAGVAP